MRKILIAIGGIVVLGAVAVGLSQFQDKPVSAPESKETPLATKKKEARDPNKHGFMDADFAKKMIVHNQQGIQIADMAKERATNEEVRRVAATISAELSAETQQYISWLTEWKETYFNLSDFPEMEGHDMYPTHPGMASLSELDALKTASGNSIDEQFLNLMIKHHEGADEMANSIAYETMQFGKMLELKAKTLKRQAEEIRTMKQLQSQEIQ